MKFDFRFAFFACCVVACGAPIQDRDEEKPTLEETREGLWPLSTGSQWTFRITDATTPPFEKSIEVVGLKEVPEGGKRATQVRSVQPHLEEISWQTVEDGLVLRLYEEDRKDGRIVRSAKWTPGTIKSLAQPRSLGWSTTVTAREKVEHEDGTLEDEDKSYTWTVAAVDETVTVPAGTFVTIRVERTRPGPDKKLRTYWLAPGVGKVKEDGERLEELVRYQIQEE